MDRTLNRQILAFVVAVAIVIIIGAAVAYITRDVCDAACQDIQRSLLSAAALDSVATLG